MISEKLMLSVCLFLVAMLNLFFLINLINSDIKLATCEGKLEITESAIETAYRLGQEAAVLKVIEE